MTVSITHTTVATGADDPSKEINKGEWNAEHSVSGLGDAAEKNVGTGAGDVAAGNAPAAAQAAAEATAAAALAAHVAAGDPHPTYLTAAEGNAAYEASGAVAAHAGAADPHTGYQKESEKDAANGYLGADANARLALTKLEHSSATAKVLARRTAGAGAWEESSLTQVFDFAGGAAAADGDILYRASGAWVRLAKGAADKVLKMAADGSLPEWRDDATTAGGGDGLGPDGDKGDVTVGGTGTTLTIDANAVTDTKLRDSAAVSVIGRSANSAGDPADIAAGANDRVLRRTGDALDFGQLTVGMAADNTWTNAKLAQMASNTIKGNNTGGAANASDLSVANVLTMLAAFSGITVQVFTATGANTYTPTSGMKYCLVFSTGAGGGGGGADVTGAADAGAGAGGGAGGTCIEAFSAATIGVSQTVTIGTGGTAGSNTGGTGGNGGNTTFGALHTANGGSGGTGSGAASTANTRVVAGGAGGTPSGGTANITGGTGDNGWAMQTTDATDANETSIAFGGQGGASMWGGGGRGGANAQDAAAGDSTAGSEAGANGAAPGSGGGGGAVNNTATGVAGGTGANGFCVVIEFT